MEHKNESIVFLGRSATAKSTIFNSIIGNIVSESGISYGSPITKRSIYAKCKHRILWDTPSIDFLSKQIPAIWDITDVLNTTKYKKIIFCVTTCDGDFILEDIFMINKICESISGPFMYGVIFNIVSNKFTQVINDRINLFKKLLKNLNFIYHVILLDIDLLNENNKLLSTKEVISLIRFINNVQLTDCKFSYIGKTYTGDSYDEEIRDIRKNLFKVKK